MSKDLKLLLSAGLPFLASLLLFVSTLKFGFAKVSEVRTKLAKTRVDVATLEQKVDILSDITDNISTVSGASSTALPDTNPALIAISQLKLKALEKGLVLTNIKTSGEIPEEGGVKKVNITFDIEGSRVLVFAFLGEVDNIAPLSAIEKTKLSEVGGATRGSIVVKSFWAELPTKLPSLTEKIASLTPDETKTLAELTSLLQPQFANAPPAESTNARPDPFSF